MFEVKFFLQIEIASQDYLMLRSLSSNIFTGATFVFSCHISYDYAYKKFMMFPQNAVSIHSVETS